MMRFSCKTELRCYNGTQELIRVMKIFCEQPLPKICLCFSGASCSADIRVGIFSCVHHRVLLSMPANPGSHRSKFQSARSPRTSTLAFLLIVAFAVYEALTRMKSSAVSLQNNK
eukprot:IDg3641t1